MVVGTEEGLDAPLEEHIQGRLALVGRSGVWTAEPALCPALAREGLPGEAIAGHHEGHAVQLVGIVPGSRLPASDGGSGYTQEGGLLGDPRWASSYARRPEGWNQVPRSKEVRPNAPLGPLGSLSLAARGVAGR